MLVNQEVLPSLMLAAAPSMSPGVEKAVLHGGLSRQIPALHKISSMANFNPAMHTAAICLRSASSMGSTSQRETAKNEGGYLPQ